MAKLKDIRGTAIQFRDADPVVYVGAWSSGGTMNTGRHAGGGSGAQTAAIVFGGQDPKRAQTETYDGTSFTEVNDMNTARSVLGNAGQGSQTATLAFGGIEPALSAKTESWNGTSWTEVNDLNAARGYVSGFGTQTAAICANGYPPDTANVESWNGTSWTEVNNTPYAYSSAAGSGTQTAGLVFGGYYPPVGYNTASFEFDGTNWTSGGTMNTGRSNLEGAGLQTDTLIFGGATAPIVAKSESYDGTSFTEVADLSTAISSSMPGGTSGTAVLSAGGAPGSPSASEEFSFPGPTSSTLQEGDMWFNSSSSALKGYGTAVGIPAGTWASGGTLNAGHGYGTGFGGTQTAAVCCFGGYPTHTNNTETYNGTAWTEVNEGNTARRNLGSFGILTSGLAFGGGPPFGSAITESWNGTSWTEVNDLPSGTYNNRGIGASSSSGLSIGGVDNSSGVDALAYEWSGSSWSEISEMSTNRQSGSAANAGSTTAALVFGGESPSLTVNTELWNGSSWTELNNLNTARGDAGGNGISTQALCFGGNTPSAPPYQTTKNEFWNGTSWTELNDLGTGIANGIAPAGGATSGLASGGQSAPATQNTVSQEFTASAAVSTVTTS